MFQKALSIVAVAGFGMSTGLAAAAERWDMATPYPDANFHTRNIVAFARDVNAATNGELKITIHCNGSLFKHPDIKRSVRRGLVPIGETLISLLANEDPIYAVDSIPFLATSYEDAKKLWKASRGRIESALEKDGLKVLYAVPWTPQGLYTANPVDGVADLEGVKFRAYNPTTSRFAELTGMVATQVEVPELPVAFATGIVEAMITGAETGANSKAWDFVSHFYDVGAWLPKNMVVVNATLFDRLPETVRKAVVNVAAKAEARGWDMSMTEAEAKKKILADNGVNVAAPSAGLKADLAKVGETMLADWLRETGDEGKAVIGAFRN